jgi:hypothetical protein
MYKEFKLSSKHICITPHVGELLYLDKYCNVCTQRLVKSSQIRRNFLSCYLHVYASTHIKKFVLIVYTYLAYFYVTPDDDCLWSKHVVCNIK